MPTLFLGGPVEFVRECKDAAGRCNVQVVGEAVSPADLYMLVDRVHPDGLLLPAGRDWIRAAVDLAKVRPNMLVFISGPISADIWAKLAEHRVMTVPADPEKAVPGVVAAMGRLAPQRFVFEDQDITPPQMVSQRTVAIPAKVIAVYSAKGGVGKTTVAENVAAVLGLWAKKQEEETGTPCRVALIDTNLDGSTGVYTWSPHSRPKTASLWHDINISVLRWQDVSTAMNYNETANVWYLAPPIIPEEKERFNRELVDKILTGCQRFFHFMIIDTGVALKDRDATIASLVAATDVLLVADFKYKSLRLLADAYKYEIKQMISDPLKFALVLNRVKKTWFTTKDFVVAFAREAGDAIPLKGELPEEPALEKKESETKGVPFVCVHPENAFSKSIMALCRNVLGADLSFQLNGKSGNPGGWLSRIFRKHKRAKVV